MWQRKILQIGPPTSSLPVLEPPVTPCPACAELRIKPRAFTWTNQSSTLLKPSAFLYISSAEMFYKNLSMDYICISQHFVLKVLHGFHHTLQETQNYFFIFHFFFPVFIFKDFFFFILKPVYGQNYLLGTFDIAYSISVCYSLEQGVGLGQCHWLPVGKCNRSQRHKELEIPPRGYKYT